MRYAVFLVCGAVASLLCSAAAMDHHPAFNPRNAHGHGEAQQEFRDPDHPAHHGFVLDPVQKAIYEAKNGRKPNQPTVPTNYEEWKEHRDAFLAQHGAAGASQSGHHHSGAMDEANYHNVIQLDFGKLKKLCRAVKYRHLPYVRSRKEHGLERRASIALSVLGEYLRNYAREQDLPQIESATCTQAQFIVRQKPTIDAVNAVRMIVQGNHAVLTAAEVRRHLDALVAALRESRAADDETLDDVQDVSMDLQHAEKVLAAMAAAVEAIVKETELDPAATITPGLPTAESECRRAFVGFVGAAMNSPTDMVANWEALLDRLHTIEVMCEEDENLGVGAPASGPDDEL